jgi:hypothetical protein
LGPLPQNRSRPCIGTRAFNPFVLHMARKTTPGKPVKRPRRQPRSVQRKLFRVRVRMYRQGLGDCFLITFAKQSGSEKFHILIDCGVLKGTNDAGKILTDVAKDIAATTENRLNLVIATHQHWDHLSGFHQARPVFDQIRIDEVWMAWTEDKTNPLTRKLERAKQNALRLIRAGLTKRSLPSESSALAGVEGLLGFYGERSGAAKSETTETALDYLRDRVKNAKGVKYRRPGEGPLKLDGVSIASIYVLGPPEDESLIRRVNPTRAKETYELRVGLSGEFLGLAAALDPLPDATAAAEEAERHFPFSREHRRTSKDPEFGLFFNNTYENKDERWRRIDDDWLAAVGQLALQLDNATNNTSLALAIELDSGEVLLFPADAQVGNWTSWEKLSWKSTENSGERQVTLANLLARTVLYKVGHHGSHNATVKRPGLEQMTSDDLVAFIPVDKTTARAQGKSGWEMPARGLYKRLKEAAHNRVVLSDRKEEPPAGLPAHVRVAEGYIDFLR